VTRSKIYSPCSLGAVVLALALAIAPLASAQPPGGGRGGFNSAPDPRVEQRSYHFEDTDEQLAYALFVSSKVSKDEAAPLIVALHGLSGDGNSLLRGRALELAEEGGYILVGPLGYNPSGWFGSPVIVMGGAGALFLGQKYADDWVAVAAIAPAAFMMQRDAATILTPMKDKGVPVMIVQGDADTVVPPENTRAWAEALEALDMEHEYIEFPGGDHGSVITDGMPGIFEYFETHAR
jgi:predicted esterase